MVQKLVLTRRLLGTAVVISTSALVFAGCGTNSVNNSDTVTTKALTIGTTEKVATLDPAGSYDNGSWTVMNQVFAFILNAPYGSPDVKPDLAESASFTSPTSFTVKLKPKLKFANGHDLTSSDVKFTFDRQLAIKDPNGPSSLLGNLASVTAPDPKTVVFTLKVPNDQTFAQVLSSPAGPIVDEETFSATAVTPDDTIVKANAFEGQYVITSYNFNSLIQYKINHNYKGALGAPATDVVNVKYYSDSSNMKLDVQKGTIDVACRSLTATDIGNLRTDSNVKVVDGPGGEIRYIVFNFNTQPYGSSQPDANAAKALAVRKAIANLVDRAAIATQVYKNTYTPLYSFVPQGLTGATTVLKNLYGDGNGGPSLDKAKAILTEAGISEAVNLKIQYNPDHYGPGSADEYALVKSQLENGGLFKVDLQSTEWVQYTKDRVKDTYPLYQLGWFPDYSDADNYLTPFFSKDNFVGNHYDNTEVQALISKQSGETDSVARQKEIEQIQATVAQDLSTVPLLQGAQVAVVGKDVIGTDRTLDASFRFRYGAISKP